MSFKKKDNERYYNPIRRAILTYRQIEPGDRVAVGLSGGKDSTALFYFLDRIRREERLGFSFDLVPIALDMEMGMDYEPLLTFLASLGYELELVPTKIAPIVFDIRQEKSPCSLCAKLRNGILHRRAKELGCTKVALGHHLDDAFETYLMNFFLHGKMVSFEPKSFLSRNEITLIRPLIYVDEQAIIQFVKREGLPVISNPCPVDKKTKREEMKHVIQQLEKDYPDIRKKFIQGMESGQASYFWQVPEDEKQEKS